MRGDDFIMEISQYWDNDGLTLDVYAKTKSKQRLIGSCKYTNAKVKKSELSRIDTLAKEANIHYDGIVIVAKKSFSKELKEQKSSTLQLLTLKNFKVLVE
jgi:translation elongation factor EF-4